MATYSIIVPVYNAEKYLEQAISSVINQTVADWELILVDDGSSDKSLEICQTYQKLDNRIKVIEKENGGVSDTRNEGIRFATGQYIVFLDSDDWLSLDCLEKADAVLKQNTVDLLVCNHFDSNASGNTKAKPISEALCDGVKENAADLIDFTLRLVGWKKPLWYGLMRPVWAKVFRRDIIADHGMRFDKDMRYGEDAAFLLEYLTYISIIAYRNDYVYYYRDNPSSAMNNKKWNGPEPGAHYFDVVERSLHNVTNEEALAAFWYNITENDWNVLNHSQLRFGKKLQEMKALLVRPDYIRFSDAKLARKFSTPRKIQAFLILKRCAFLIFGFQFVKQTRNNIKNVKAKKKKALKTYVHFYNACNFGDDAFVLMLSKRYPNNTFFISGEKEYLRAFENVENIVPKYETPLKWFLSKVCFKLFKKDLLFAWNARGCQNCMTIGGSIFIEPEAKDLARYLQRKKSKLYSGKSNLIIGANFGPYKNERFLQFFREDLRRYNYISFRDEDSYDLFKDIPNVHYAPDILFGIRNLLSQDAEAPINGKPYVVISVINKVADLNLYKSKIREIMDFYHSQEFEIVMLSLCEMQGDALLCKEIASDVDFEVKILRYDGSNMQETIRCIQSASYVIGSRFHAIVSALTFQVPCIPIVYSNKTENMLKDIHYSGRHCMIDNLNRLSMQDIDENRRNQYIPDVNHMVEASQKHFAFLDKVSG